MLRPERIAVNPVGRVFQNRFKTVIQESIYSGDHIRCLLDIFGRADWSTKIVDQSASAGMRRGVAVEIAWNAEDCLLFNPQGEH